MQTTKKSMNRNGPLEASQKSLPAGQYTTGSEYDATSSTCTNTSTPTKKSSKFIELRSPRSPASERKHTVRINELESRVSELEEHLKKTKKELANSESLKRRAQQESEEAKKHWMVVTAKLEETQNQLQELCEYEDDRILELRKLGQERDRAWQSELEAMHQQHRLDSSALASAMNEMQRLRTQLERVARSGVVHATSAEVANSELCTLKEEMTEARSLLKTLGRQMQEFQVSEVTYKKLLSGKDVQLEAAEATIERLHADGVKMMDSLSSLSLELEESKARVSWLEELVKNSRSECEASGSSVLAFSVSEHCGQLTASDALNNSSLEHEFRTELRSLQLLVDELRLALEASEIRYHEDQVKNTMQIQSAYEALEKFKFFSGLKEAELESALNGSELKIAKLKASRTENNESRPQSLRDLDGGILDSGGERFQRYEEENKLDSELTKLMEDVTCLKASLTDKETEMQLISEENEFLRLEMEKNKPQGSRDDEVGIDVRIEAVAKEQDNNNGMLEDTRQSEQPEAALFANSKLEVELRRLKIQSEQWRKAAEMATAILVTEDIVGSTGRAGAMHPDHYHTNTIVEKLNLALSADVREESLKKKNVVLKKIGVLWKKGQK